MLRQQPARLPNKLSIFMWNPPWETFQHLSLEDKISAFKEFVTTSQEHFQSLKNVDADSVCLIVAPDLIFAPAGSEDDIFCPTYSYKEKKLLDEELAKIRTNLDHCTLVIAGSIEYATKNESHYKITTPVLSHAAIQTYDKKKPTSCLRSFDGYPLHMERGTKSGVIHFNGRTIGLEICQDHEEATLKTELGQKTVDIHVLLSDGQHKRPDRICTDKYYPGVFIHCEREPNKVVPALVGKKTFETSDTYTVIKKMNHSVGNSARHRLFAALGDTTNMQGKSLEIVKCLPSPVLNISSEISLSQTSLPQLSSTRQLINAIHKLTLHPIWPTLTTIGDIPNGIQKIAEECVKHFPSDVAISKQEATIHKQIQILAYNKRKSWSFGRDDITDVVYEVLAKDNITIDDIHSLERILDERLSITSKPASSRPG